MMERVSDHLQRALQAGSRSELLSCLLPGRPTLTLPDIQRLTQRLETLGEPGTSLRIAVLHTYTSDLLEPYLKFEALLQGFQPVTYHAPYNAIVQEASPGSGLLDHRPDLTLLLLRWEDLDPGLAGSLHALGLVGQERLTVAVRARLMEQLAVLRQAVTGHFLVTLLPALHEPGLGDYDVNIETAEHGWRSRTKSAIAFDLRTSLPSTSLLDLDESMAAIGRGCFFDLRWWYTARFPFSPTAAQDLARRVVTVGTALKRPRAKVIALDADNTLWGGIIGEDGLEGIVLGPEYPGNVYLAFQRRLIDYQQRGFILALCSKNNEADVLDVLRRHPHQLLREEHFAGMRVNWNPKPDNLKSLADELNLGLDSFVYVDDSAHECLAIHRSLPEVDVIQIPSRPLDIPGCLDRVARLEIVALTAEDRQKTAMYAQERKRRDLATASNDVESYLRSLEMVMSIAIDDARQTARISQLTQKTNQFTLTTRRYSEDDIASFVRAADWLVAHFSLRDIFGDSGIVGVAIVRLSAEVAEVDSFLMSCRVIGRKAESAFLEAVLAELRDRGVKTVVADYLPSAKNMLAAAFLSQCSFEPREDGRFARSLHTPAPAYTASLPIAVRVAGGISGRTT